MCLLNQSNALTITDYQFFFKIFTNFITKSYYNMITIHTHVTNHFYFLIVKLYKFIIYFDGIAENYFISGSSIRIVHTQGTKLNQEVTQGDYETLLIC